MDFQNDHFQEFIRMKDSEVEKLLNRHPRSAKYFNVNNSISCSVGFTKKYICLRNDLKINVSDAGWYQYTFKKYIDDKKEYVKSFFKTLGTERTVNFIERRCKFYYGEENVWVNSNNGSVIIHFPEVVITNSLDDSHLMKDLFFKIEVSHGRICSVSLARTTVNENEVDRYIFSHLNFLKPGEYSGSLCFGNTEMDAVYARIREDNDFRNIDKFIVSIGGYLSWESLEGVPYVKFGDYKTPKIDGIIATYYYNENHMNNALNLISNSNIKLRYKAELKDNGDTSIKLSNVYEIDELLKHNSIPQFKRFKNKSYLRIEKATCPGEEHYPSSIVFKDNTIPVKIEKTEGDVTADYMCHVGFLNRVVEMLENKLLNYLIEKDNE